MILKRCLSFNNVGGVMKQPSIAAGEVLLGGTIVLLGHSPEVVCSSHAVIVPYQLTEKTLLLEAFLEDRQPIDTRVDQLRAGGNDLLGDSFPLGRSPLARNLDQSDCEGFEIGPVSLDGSNSFGDLDLDVAHGRIMRAGVSQR